MNRNYFWVLVGIAAACLALILFSMGHHDAVPVNRELQVPNPKSPYKEHISGVGVVEPGSGNIYISSPLNRNIDKVLVKVGTQVKKDQDLILLENRDLRADYIVQEMNYKNALVRLKKLKDLPREEDLNQAKASLNFALADYDQAKKQYDMVLSLPDQRAISQDEKNRRYANFQQAEAKRQQAQAEYNKVKSGTWEPDLQIGYFDVLQAKANLENIKSEIERTIIRSPIDGTVLQIKVHEGESSTSPTQSPLMIIGNIDTLNLRVNINQFDIPFFNPKAKATAFPQGDARFEYPLEFLHVEPFLTTKQNLNNEVFEKVDTKVLQILYRIENPNSSVFVGQQMDAFIETKGAE
jgi:HlyD family secretion protein